MTKSELIKKLNECALLKDKEAAHYDADVLLLEYIGDPEVSTVFHALDKWYA